MTSSLDTHAIIRGLVVRNSMIMELCFLRKRYSDQTENIAEHVSTLRVVYLSQKKQTQKQNKTKQNNAQVTRNISRNDKD